MQSENPSRAKFVKHINQDFPSEIRKTVGVGIGNQGCPLATIIIPTLDGYRNGYFPKLLEQIKSQKFQDFEMIIVKGDPRQGRAINTAAAMARGKILIILDDDIRFGHEQVLGNLVKTLEENPDIGMAGVSNLIPSDASWLVKRTMQELPRRHSALVDKITDSDMAEHPCCAIPKKVFYEVGGEREDIRRGLDPYLRYMIRTFGYRVVVIPNTWIHHLPPDNLRKLIQQFFRNGLTVGLDRRTFKEAPYEVAQGHISSFKPQRHFIYRAVRFLFRILQSIFTLRFIYLISLLLYACGLAYGRVMQRNE
jgi:glycosyltransferase involved in cell wall biosynthesis